MLLWLEGCGYKNINIIDNNSDYKPLLDFYTKCTHKVIRMKKNYGHTVFYDSRRFLFKRLFNFYILSDPDLAPIEGCPNDFSEQFLNIMADYPEYYKVGFSLMIDDLPDNYKGTISWEAQFWKYPLESSKYPCAIYQAAIDTTFALNSPSIYHTRQDLLKAIRTGKPYQLRHLPWYVTSLNNEEANYVNTARPDISSWGRAIRKRLEEKGEI